MPRTDNPVSVATTTEAPAVDNGPAPVPPVTSNTAPATAKTDATVDSLLPAKVGQSGESEEVGRTNRGIDEVPFLSVFAVALLSLIALPIAWVNDPSHKLLTDHTPWIFAGYGLLFAVVILAVLAWWSKGRDAAV